MKYRRMFVLCLCFLLATCNMPQAESNQPQAWIDAPLDGSILPLAPYEIILHAFAPGVPAAVELTINGQPVTLSAEAPEEPLTVIRYQWDPPTPGRYTLRARTQDATGNWSGPHIHTVTVEGATPTPTATFTSTATEVITVTASPTFTPTSTPTSTATPTINIPAGFNNHGLSTNSVSRGRCKPWQVTIQVDAQHPVGIKVVVLFFRLENMQNGKLSSWNDGLSMNISSGHYTRTLSGDQLGALADYPEARVHYQFVLQPTEGEYVRSEVYSDLYVVPCGGGGITPLPPLIPGDIIIFPTATDIIVK